MLIIKKEAKNYFYMAIFHNRVKYLSVCIIFFKELFSMDIDRIIGNVVNRFVIDEGLLLESPTAESCWYKGKCYNFYNCNIPCMPFLFIDSRIRYGDSTGIFVDNHEMIALLYCYYLLNEEPPFDDIFPDRYSYRKMYDYIRDFHGHLIDRVYERIRISGRYFVMDDGNIIFVTYEDLDEASARRMMLNIINDKDLDPEKCYYQKGFMNNVTYISFVKRI